MRAGSVNPGGMLFLPIATALGLAAFWMSMQGSAIPAVAVAVIVVALFVLLVSPTAAMLFLALSRFSFEMAWEERVAGLGLLDFLGAGVPAGVVVLLLVSRPRLAHIPLMRPVLCWVGGLWLIASLYLLAGGDPLVTIENTLKFTGGAAVFIVAAITVRRYPDALRLTLFWVAGSIPVALVFFYYGASRAMDYHGVQRLRALYHDPGTPAIVASLGILSSIAVLRTGLVRGWRARYIALFAIWILVLSRLLFQTFSGAMTASTFAAILVMLALERKWGYVLTVFVLMFGFSQIPSVQKRWYREISIAEGQEEAVSFASGRPNRWKRFIRRYEHAPPVEQMAGVHGTWGSPENGFLHLWFDLGPMGAAWTCGLLLWIVASLRRWWREEPRPDVRLIYGLTLSVCIGYIVSWITGTPFYWINFQWFIWSMIGACAAMRLRDTGDPEAEPADEPAPA